MRLLPLLFTVILTALPAVAQQTADVPVQDGTQNQATKDQAPNLPVSIDKIRGALQTTSLLSLSTIDESPTFRIQIREKQHLDELLATLNFKAGPIPAGGLYMAEQDRIVFPSVDKWLKEKVAAGRE